MILFGHLGLTFAAVNTLDKKILKALPHKPEIDYRLVFLGSILPDLIDKSIIFFRSNETFKSGRLIAHTLLFELILVVLGLLFRKKKKSVVILVLAATCLIHQILDSMWNYIDIYFWPVYGLFDSNGKISIVNWLHYLTNVFNKENTELSFFSIKERLISSPVIGISEIIGFLIILFFIIRLFKFKQIKKFLKFGIFNFSVK